MGTDAADEWYEVDVEDEQILHFAQDFLARYTRSHGDAKKAHEAALDHLVRMFPKENRHTLSRALEQVSGQRLAGAWFEGLDDPFKLLDGPGEPAPEVRPYGPGGAEAELVTARLASGQQWVYVNGVVKFGDSLWELASQAGREAGLTDDEATRVSNLIARGQIPPMSQTAAGTMQGGRPSIWMSTTDRNAVMSAVLAASATASAQPAI